MKQKILNKTYKVTAINKSAFKSNKKIKTVTIGENVTTIGKDAFNGCKNLKTITIKSKNLKTVGGNAIKNMNKSAKIKVPSSKVNAYKKLFQSAAGWKKTMKISK